MLNKCILIGRLTREIDLRYTQDGTPVANACIACNRRKSNGEEAVSFIDITVWGKDAENFDKFHKKGELVYIEGRIDQENWLDKDGAKRSKHKVTCERWRFVSEITGGGSKPRDF